MRQLVEDIFRSQAKWLRVYTGTEIVQDPFEKNVVVTYCNPLSIRAIVEDMTATQANWKMPGIKVAKVKEIFVEKKYRPLIEMSQKIEFEGEMYEGWKENGKLQIREQTGGGSATAKRYGGYLKMYIYTKGV